MTSSATHSSSSKSLQWYLPTFSPEHGVYVMLIVSLLTGAAAAQQWTWATTLALICGFCGFQAEHPLVWQIKQRKKLQPRLLLWASIYGGVAGAIALWFLWHNLHILPLLLIYGIAIAALIFDVVSVWHRQQKSRLNEIVTFAAVCLLAPLAYTVTVGTISHVAIALWVLNTLFFSSAIFTVKLRKTKTASIIPGIIFHGTASAIVLALWLIGWLAPITASAFGVALVKFTLILWQKNWYCTTKIQQVASLETVSSFAFLVIIAFSLLPPYLSE
ncbi:MAG: YwiC-like family protein [Xenococcaceae cyanobacterium MO_188.B32]|nr:YwiC-like family protein [Xenococcaceae cyanobacterium MO_188.B32]